MKKTSKRARAPQLNARRAGFVCLALGASFASQGASAAAQWPHFDARPIRTPAGMTVDTGEPMSVNNAGQVVGSYMRSTGFDVVFSVSPSDLAPTILCADQPHACVAAAINDAGSVVGFFESDDPFGWQSFRMNVDGSGFTMTGTDQASWSVTYGENAAGGTCGQANFPGHAQSHAFVALNGGAMEDLGTLDGTESYSVARGMDATGTVVGESDVGSTIAAFVKRPGRPMHALGSLGSYGASAEAISASGWIAGWTSTSTSMMHAMVAREGNPMIDMGALDAAANSSNFEAINARGAAVGWSDSAQGWHAVIASADRAHSLTDLNTLVKLPAGKVLTWAKAINDAGQIVAVGSDGNVWVLTPKAR